MKFYEIEGLGNPVGVFCIRNVISSCRVAIYFRDALGTRDRDSSSVTISRVHDKLVLVKWLNHVI